jgi:hypothetical protein
MQSATTNDDLMQRMNEQLKRISNDVVHVTSALTTQNRSASPPHGHQGISCAPRHAMLVLYNCGHRILCSILTAYAWMQYWSHSFCLSTHFWPFLPPLLLSVLLS